MPDTVLSPYRHALRAIAVILGLSLSACSGGSDGGPTGPGPEQPGPGQPGPGQPGPGQPGPGQPGPEDPPPAGVAGHYVLTQINDSHPGQMVTLSNPGGVVIGIYRFDAASELTLDALQTFEMTVTYSDEKDQYGVQDAGEFKPAGESQGALVLNFTSAVYGDQFTAAAIGDFIAIKYDLDGDGQLDTVLGFQRVGG